MEGLLFGLASHADSKESLQSLQEIDIPVLQRYRQYLAVKAEVHQRAVENKRSNQPIFFEDEDLARIWGPELIYPGVFAENKHDLADDLAIEQENEALRDEYGDG